MTSGILSRFPPGQFLRYLLIGGWNTAFGFFCFLFLNRWLSTLIPTYSYIVANIIAHPIAITQAFLGYKWFVFRTKGNYFQEWLRALNIYGGGVILSTLALAPLVGLIRHTTQYQTQAPYIAGAFVTGFTVIASFFGHRHFSFRKTTSAADAPAEPGR